MGGCVGLCARVAKCPVQPCNRILEISFSIYEIGYQGSCRNQNGKYLKKNIKYPSAVANNVGFEEAFEIHLI